MNKKYEALIENIKIIAENKDNFSKNEDTYSIIIEELKTLKNEIITTKDERSIRDLLSQEHSTIKSYQELAVSADSEDVRKIFLDIANEEIVHVGELEELLKRINMFPYDLDKEGANEVDKKLSESFFNNSDRIIKYESVKDFVEDNPDYINVLMEISKRLCGGRPLSEDEINKGYVRVFKDFADITDQIYFGTGISGSEVIKDLYNVATNTIKQRDNAYNERNKLVSFLSRLYPSHLAKHDINDNSWDDDWRNIVYINSPEGQLSWHIHDSELPLFSHLVFKENNWDGHSTEEKYSRLNKINSGKQDVKND